MNGFKDLLHSERGAFCLAALVAATMLVVIGKLDGATWLDFIKYLSGALVASKTITTAVETYTLKKPQIDSQTSAVPEARVVRDNTDK